MAEWVWRDVDGARVRGSEAGRAIAGPDAAFLVAVAEELGRIRRMALLLAGDPASADDLVGEAVARTLPRWRSGEVDDCGAYLRRAVVNLASHRWRRLAVGRRRDHAALHWLSDSTDAAEVVVERDRTLRAVMRLPVRRRAIVILRFYEDLPLAQIAAALGVSDGTVKSQLSRALDQLRGDLDGEEAT